MNTTHNLDGRYTNLHERLTSKEEVKPRSIKDEIERIQLVFDKNPRYHELIRI